MPPSSQRSISLLEVKPSTVSSRNKSFDCRICHKDHPIRRCLKFKRMNVTERMKVIQRFHYCENCLALSHSIRRCRNTDRCRHCGGKHHTLLHRHERLRESQPSGNSSSLIQSSSRFRSITLLPTVIIKLHLDKEWGNVRGLLNPCVQFSSMAKFIIDRYNLPVENVGSEKWCKIRFRPRFDENPVLCITVKIVSDLPRKHPLERIDERVADLYTNLRLADPNFHRNDDLNFVLGADIYPRIIRPGIQPESIGTPMAQDTILGWTLIGKFGV